MLDFRIWTNAHAVGVVIGVSWWFMVTGQALVLYSRLYLVVRNQRRIRWVLIMIITNFWILHIPIMLLSQIGYSTLPTARNWLAVYKVYEKVQMTGFTIQETIISSLYLWETRKILSPAKTFQRHRTRQVIYNLIYLHIFIIILDLALLATEYANLFMIQTVFKAAVYSLKLRFEFVVLNQLMEYVQGRTSTVELGNSASNADGGGASRRGGVTSIPLNSIKDASSDPPVVVVKGGSSYSVFASKGLGSQIDTRNVDGVLRTTEVHVVHDSPKSSEEELEEGGVGHASPHEIYAAGHGHGHGQAVSTNDLFPDIHGHEHREEGAVAAAAAQMEPHARTSSPSSSVIEFAGRGA
ncbi:MAG: hypothetical protein Q9164_004290 [Protoblastenia rupestris]